MKKKIATVLKKSGLPALVVVKAGETTDVLFRPYVITAGDDETTVLIGGGDSDKHSPIDGERIEPKDGVSETASSTKPIAEVTTDFPVIAHCTDCDHDTMTTKELAVAMDGVSFHCANCGGKLNGEYYGDFEETAGDDELDDSEAEASDDEAEDAADDGADEEEEEDSEDDSGEEATDDTDDASDADAADAAEATDEDDTSDEDDSTDEDDMAEEDAKTSVRVVSAKMVDSNNDVRIVQATAKRYEVFVGDNHLGYLNMDMATANVTKLQTNSDAFRRSVIMTVAKDLPALKKTGKVTEDLTNFGMKLAEVEVPISEAVDTAVNVKVEEVKQTAEATQVAQEEATSKALEIAMAGLNKGIIPGPNFVTAFAKTLKRFGVKNAVEEAARVVEETASNFIATAQATAKDIVKQGPDYGRGLAQSIASAQYVRPSEAVVEDPSMLTASAFAFKPEPVVEVKANTNVPAAGQRFKKLFAGMR